MPCSLWTVSPCSCSYGASCLVPWVLLGGRFDGCSPAGKPLQENLWVQEASERRFLPSGAWLGNYQNWNRQIYHRWQQTVPYYLSLEIGKNNFPLISGFCKRSNAGCTIRATLDFGLGQTKQGVHQLQSKSTVLKAIPNPALAQVGKGGDYNTAEIAPYQLLGCGKWQRCASVNNTAPSQTGAVT